MITTHCENDSLRISYQQGHQQTAVIAFTGIGKQLGALQVEEFRGSLAAGEGAHSPTVIFVIDKKRRWYNDGLSAPIIQQVNGLLDRMSIARSVTLGNSMGGFGALVFARHLRGCRGAIAFRPQSSVKPQIAGFENRWDAWRRQISAWDIEDATRELVEGLRYDLFFGANDPIDMRHAERFRQLRQANVCLHVIAGCEHDVAAHLKRRGELKLILQNLIAAGMHDSETPQEGACPPASPSTGYLSG